MGFNSRLDTLQAALLRVNLPIALLMTLYTNPLTIVPLYFAAYKIGGEQLFFPNAGQ